MSNVAAMTAPSHVRVAGEGSDFRAIAADVTPRGNLVPDTHLVALLREHGVSTIWSHDRDLRRFRGNTVRDPFAPDHSTGFEEPYSRSP